VHDDPRKLDDNVNEALHEPDDDDDDDENDDLHGDEPAPAV
jgi:hypothetical protein